MATFLYSASMSLDGYIAGPGGDMSWLTPHLGPDPLIDDLTTKVGAILAGNRTFRGDDPHRGGPGEGEAFGGGWEGPQIVLTHHIPADSWPGVTFAPDLTTAVTLSAAAAGDAYVNVLGADVARQLIATGRLDEILVSIVPVLLGGGTPLFATGPATAPAGAALRKAAGTPVELERIRSAEVPHASDLWFRVLR